MDHLNISVNTGFATDSNIYRTPSESYVDLAQPGARLVTFNNILRWKAIPLPPVLEVLLRLTRQWMGCEVEDTIDYPGWQPEFHNPLLNLTADCFRALFGGEPAIKAIHAGLECGILKSKKAGLDVVSFGPTIRGAHSPRERLDIATVEPFWRLLLSVLERIRNL